MALSLLLVACGTSSGAPLRGPGKVSPVLLLCQGPALHGICRRTTNILKNFRTQDIVFDDSVPIGVNQLQIVLEKRSTSNGWREQDVTSLATDPKGNVAWGPASQWGSHIPWPNGQYKIVVVIHDKAVASTAITVNVS